MTDKLTPKQYIEALRDLRQRIDPEAFVTANNYIEAAGKMTGAYDVDQNWTTIQSVTEVALRLVELYPDGLPLTFGQLARMEERGMSVLPARQIPDWWAGRT